MGAPINKGVEGLFPKGRQIRLSMQLNKLMVQERGFKERDKVWATDRDNLSPKSLHPQDLFVEAALGAGWCRNNAKTLGVRV
jgi:hypothetical protein